MRSLCANSKTNWLQPKKESEWGQQGPETHKGSRITDLQEQITAAKPIGQQLRSYQDRTAQTSKQVANLRASIQTKEAELAQLRAKLTSAENGLVKLQG